MAKNNGVYSLIEQYRSEGRTALAVLVDPDKADENNLSLLCDATNEGKVDLFLVGGSLLTSGDINETVSFLKANCSTPVILFPGSAMQLNSNADAILFLSLISGRNPDLLIGKHVEATPFLMKNDLEVIPTGYMIIDGGKSTSASYMSNTQPIPIDKPELAMCTAKAGEFLGLKSIYLEAGSGALNPVPLKAIEMIKSACDIPIIVGGGIRDGETVRVIAKAGADVVVVGSRLEDNPNLIHDLYKSLNSAKTEWS